MASSYEILMSIGGKLSPSLTQSTSGVSKSLLGVQKTAEGVTKSVSKGLGSIKNVVVGAVATVGVATSFNAIMNAASKSEQTTAQLKSVLKSTGGVAGVTQEAAEKLAGSLSSVTTFSKGTVIGAESLLLTFTKIGKDVMPDATETVLNMSQALGQDTKSSAIQLGKALNDPVKGITALTRVGVTFTKAQKDQITAMTKAGDVAGAQKLILAELGTEFGGSAKSAGATFSGQMAIIKNNMAGVGASIGLALMPTIQSVLPGITAGMLTLATFIKGNLAPAMKTAITALTPTLNTIVSIVKTDVLPAFSDAFGYIRDTIIPGVQKVLKELMPTFIRIGNIVKTDVVPAIKDGFKIAGNTIKWLGDNLNIVIPIVSGLAAAFVAYKAIMITHAAVTKTVAIAQAALNLVMAANPVALAIIGIGILVAAGVWLLMNWDKVSKGLSDTWVNIKNSFIEGINGAIGMIDKFIGVLNKIPGVNIPLLSKINLDVSGNTTSAGMQAARMAAGGYVQHRSGGIMANIGEGSYDEAVVPLKNKGGLMANIGGGSGTSGGSPITWSPQIIIQGNASKEDVTQALSESQRDFEQKMRIYEASKKRVKF